MKTRNSVRTEYVAGIRWLELSWYQFADVESGLSREEMDWLLLDPERARAYLEAKARPRPVSSVEGAR